MRKWLIIGALAVVIVFAAWWFWPAVSLNCSDIRTQETTEATFYYPGLDSMPRVTHGKADDSWNSVYYDTNGNAAFRTYVDLNLLEDDIDNLAATADTKTTLHHIADCIQAGCPGCT